MRDLAIDENGDIMLNAVGDSLEAVDDELSDISQSVRIILGTRLGEYIHDQDMGLNRINLFTNKDGTINPYLVEDIHAAIKQDERIADIEIGDSFFDTENRQLSLSLQVTMNTGEVNQVETEVNANDFI